MDEPTSPIQYIISSSYELQTHLNYCAEQLPDKAIAEIFLIEAGNIFPIVKKNYIKKSSKLSMLIRSGSVDRDKLEAIRKDLTEKDYSLKVSFTQKKKLIRRISIQLEVDDPLLSVKAINALEILSAQIGSKWPCEISMGYAAGFESLELPGELEYNNPIVEMSYRVGKFAGSLLGKIDKD